MTDSESLPGYAKEIRNTVNRYKPRARYDFLTIHTIVNASPVLHVSFPTPDPEDPFPALLPMIGFIGSFSNPDASLSSEGLDIYLHGYVSSRIMKLSSTQEGLPMTISATHFDGIVLALTPNNHSYNYRSAILQGYATPLGDEEVEEKLWAMERITDGVVSGRWAQTRVPPNKTEMKSTQILRVRVVSASAKIRKGEPHDDRGDLQDDGIRAKTWVGVIPAWTTFGTPIAGAENRMAKVPEYITDFVRKENLEGQKNALFAAAEEGQDPKSPETETVSKGFLRSILG